MTGCIQVHHCGSDDGYDHGGGVLVNIGTNLYITETPLLGEYRTGRRMFLSPDITLNHPLRQYDMLLREEWLPCLDWHAIPSI